MKDAALNPNITRWKDANSEVNSINRREVCIPHHVQKMVRLGRPDIAMMLSKEMAGIPERRMKAESRRNNSYFKAKHELDIQKKKIEIQNKRKML